MFSVILVSHGHIAESMAEVFRSMINCPFRTDFLCTDENMELEEFERQLEDKVVELLCYGDVVVLTDLKIGTPFNVVMRIMRKYPIIHITGMNLPLLLNLNLYYSPDANTQEICEKALCDAKNDLMDAGELKRRAECGNRFVENG